MAAPPHPRGGAPPAIATAQQVAVAWLRRAIAQGELAPGERIGQDAAASAVGVSAIPVREALRILESEGLVTYAPRRGYFVTELRLADLEEIYRLRGLLETDAVTRGLRDGDQRDLAELAASAQAYDQALAAGDVAAELAANRGFHFALFGLAGSEPLQRLIRMLWDATEAYRALYYSTERGASDASAAHAEILAAARRRDAAATQRALDAHRHSALEALRALLGPPARRAVAGQ
jgi:DNA-binding GntR family transcriptional regulator